MKRNVKQFGQHFLRNKALIAELVGHSSVRKTDTVLDIGAGSGAISAVLARRCHKVLAYEIEPRAVEVLRHNMTKYENVTMIQRDFLKADVPHEPYKVFSNIPFDKSAIVVTKLTMNEHPPRAIYLIVQKQFAQKLVLSNQHFHSALGIGISPWWTARIRRPLKRTDFTPPPHVDTVLLELKSRLDSPLIMAERESFMTFVRACYADPREFWKAGGNHQQKPSETSTEQWLALFDHHNNVLKNASKLRQNPPSKR